MLLTDLLHPGMLEALAGAGHGACVLLTDGHYPASTAVGPRARVVHLNVAPGLLDVPSVLDVLLRAIPVESAQVMVPPEGEPEPPPSPTTVPGSVRCRWSRSTGSPSTTRPAPRIWPWRSSPPTPVRTPTCC